MYCDFAAVFYSCSTSYFCQKNSLLFSLQELKQTNKENNKKNKTLFPRVLTRSPLSRNYFKLLWFSKPLTGHWVERRLVPLGNWPGWLVLRNAPSCQQSDCWRIKSHLKASWKDIGRSGCTIAGSCLGAWGTLTVWNEGRGTQLKTGQFWYQRNVSGFEVLLPFLLSSPKPALCPVWWLDCRGPGKKSFHLTANNVCCRCPPGWLGSSVRAAMSVLSLEKFESRVWGMHQAFHILSLAYNLWKSFP